MHTSPPIAVSTWSVHNLLGVTYANGPGVAPTGIAQPTFGAGTFAFEDLPKELAKRGYTRVEICHFHFASQDPVYLANIHNGIFSLWRCQLVNNHALRA